MYELSESDKIPLKLVQIPVEKFNNTVPQYLTQLKIHKTNIVKCLSSKNWDKVKAEEINASRILKQLKYLILEIDKVRAQVQECDHDKFDSKIEETKKMAIKGMKEYADVQIKVNTFSSQDDYSPSADDGLSTIPQIQVQFSRNNKDELRQKQECMEQLESLHREIEEVQELFVQVHGMVHEQKEMVDQVGNAIDETQVNVEVGTENLKRALTYKKALYPLAGAILGTCLGGPVGLAIGLKAGGLAALGGGVMGFAGGKFMKDDEQKQLNSENKDSLQIDEADAVVE